jgi:hypothetical protein
MGKTRVHINLNDPRAIAQKGEEIYNSKYRKEYEAKHDGKFVAINIDDESATIGDTASATLFAAREQHPNGLFHLMRVGHAGAFQVGFGFRDVPPARVSR